MNFGIFVIFKLKCFILLSDIINKSVRKEVFANYLNDEPVPGVNSRYDYKRRK